MTTVDANGIIRYEETDPVTPLQSVLNAGLQSVSDSLTPIKDASIKYVVNTSARAALAASFLPTTSKPLYVWRGNAQAGRNLEVTTDGTNWYTIRSTADDTGWLSLTPYLATGWGNLAADAAQYRRCGDTVFIRGRLVRDGSNGTTSLMSAVPAEIRPSRDTLYAAVISTTGYATQLVASAAGSINFSSNYSAGVAAIGANATLPITGSWAVG